MNLTTAAIVILSLWVIVIVAAGLVMALRPGGVPVKLGTAGAPAPAQTGNRQEIPLGGVAEVLGNFRGRVGAVLVGSETRQLQGIQLGGGISEGEVVPADAIAGADGNTVSLTDGWQDEPPGNSDGVATLTENMPVAGDSGKRLGRLRLVCYEPTSKTITALVIEGGAPHRRLVPIDRVSEVGPDRVRTNLTQQDATRLEVFATDWELRQAILERLAGDPEFQGLARGFRVEVRDQRVTLQGYVHDRAQAARVEQAVRAVPGVQRLDSEITSDDQLAQTVREALARDTAAASARLEVAVNGGVVDVTGEAPDRTTLRRIDSVLQQVEGVQVVHNMVVVPPRKPAPATS